MVLACRRRHSVFIPDEEEVAKVTGANYVFAGAVVRFQANLTGNGYPPEIKAAILARARAISAEVLSYSLTGDRGEYNLQVVLKSRIDRGEIGDIRGDLGSALTSVGLVQIRAMAINFVSNPRKDGQKQGGTVSGGIQKDTYHDNSTILGTAGQFWLDQVGQQVTGAVKALSQGSPMMWVGIGVVALIFLSRK